LETLGSNFVLLGDEALDPLLELGLDPVREPVLDVGLVPFNFLPEPILFFFLVPSTTFADFTREFCLLSFPGTDCVCLGEMAFRGNFDKGLTCVLVLLPTDISGLEGDFSNFSCFKGDFFVDDKLLSLVRIGEDFDDLFAFAADSASADFKYCLIQAFTPFTFLQEEHGSLVQGLESVRSRIEIAMYLPQSSYIAGLYFGGWSKDGGGEALPQSLEERGTELVCLPVLKLHSNV